MSSRLRVRLDIRAADLFAEVGILSAPGNVPWHLQLFVRQADEALEKVRALVRGGALSVEKGLEFQQLLVDSCARVMCHPIVASNRYLNRFAQGVSFAQARHELQQFSIFAHQFDVAQAKLVANAPTLDAYQERLKVLLNEKGIPYRDGFEGDLTGQWSMTTVHFTWLRNMAAGLDLQFEDVGKIWLALPGTRAFVDATFEHYASTDQNAALGASFGIENWAANNLWKPWIAGMKTLNATLSKHVPIGYLTYHLAEEEHHSQATLDELLENFQEPWFNASEFLSGAESTFDATWPASACEPRAFDPSRVPRLELQTPGE